jgi:hypothetical protein
MIAVITSTLSVNNAHSFFSNEDRLTQTLETIRKLDQAGFEQIFLFDNSLQGIDKQMLRSASSKLEVHQTPQYTFKNKGLNEALLLLNNMWALPEDIPIFKISGRYYPSENFKIGDYNEYPNKDFIGVGKFADEKTPFFNTRAYYIRNKQVWESTLVLAIEEMISYSKGIHGLRSLLEHIQSNFKPYLGTRYQLSMEQTFARIFIQKGNYHLLTKINIEGYIAGSEFLEFISE